MSELLLSPINHAERILSSSYSSLEKKLKEAKRLLSESRGANRRLSWEIERTNGLAMEKEKQVILLKSRIEKLARVSDESLQELLLDHLHTHNGRFNAAAFMGATGIPPSRAEEGLELLIGKGKISGGEAGALGHRASGRLFEDKSNEIWSSLTSVFNKKRPG
jgi:hypothetical protein